MFGNHGPGSAEVLSTSEGTGRARCFALHVTDRHRDQKLGILLQNVDIT